MIPLCAFEMNGANRRTKDTCENFQILSYILPNWYGDMNRNMNHSHLTKVS